MEAGEQLYTFYYMDGTFISYQLTDEEYERLGKAIAMSDICVMVGVGLLVLRDIRSVVRYRGEPVVEEHEGADPDMDEESKEWIRVNDLARRLEKEDDEDDANTDYIGGMI